MTGPSQNPYLAMAQNNAWANATLYTALADMDEATFAAPRPGFFGSLRRTLNHIYEVDLFYLDALTAGGQGRAVYMRDDTAAVQELGHEQALVDSDFIAFCRDVDPVILTEQRKTERQDGVVSETVAALILHLVQHQIHHRGQAHVMLSDAGIAPPQLDDFYLEFGRVASAKPFWS